MGADDLPLPKPLLTAGAWRLAWALVLLLLVLLPALIYVGLPALGIDGPAALFSLDRLLLMLGLLLGGLGFVAYLRAVLPRPHWLLYFIVVGWPVLEAVNLFLITQLGVNVRMRLLLILGLGAPALLLGVQHARQMLRQLPYINYVLLFFGLVAAYFLFFNAHAADPRLATESTWSDGSIAFNQFTSYYFIVVAMVLAAVSFLRHPQPLALFVRLNTLLLAGTALTALVPIIGFPFGMFCTNIDGFMRAQGLYSHPNPYAHHMGMLMTYLFGLYCFDQSQPRRVFPPWLLLASLGLNGMAFLLGLSKTGLGAFSALAVLMVLMNLSNPGMRRSAGKMLGVLAALAPLALWGYQLATGKGLWEVLEARLEETTSLNWRAEIWQALLGSLTPGSVLLGNGFTSANMLVFQMTYNTSKNAQPLILVHNGYLSLFYDFGLPGLLLFVGVLAAAGWAWGRLWQPAWAAYRPLLVTMVAMAGYFLIASGFDEMIYMFDAPLLFWVLTTVIASLLCRLAAAAGDGHSGH